MSAILGPALITSTGTFAWRAAGVALMTVAPAVTYTLKSKFDRKLSNTAPAKVLNMGLLAAGVGHLIVLGEGVGVCRGCGRDGGVEEYRSPM